MSRKSVNARIAARTPAQVLGASAPSVCKKDESRRMAALAHLNPPTRPAHLEEAPRQGVTASSLLAKGADPLALLAEAEEREAWASRKAEKEAEAAAEAKAKEEAEKAAGAEARKEAEAARKAAEKAAQEVLRLKGRIRLHQEAVIVWKAFEAASAGEKRKMIERMGENSLRAASLAQGMLAEDQRRLAALVQQ